MGLLCEVRCSLHRANDDVSSARLTEDVFFWTGIVTTSAFRTTSTTSDSSNLRECVKWEERSTSAPETRYIQQLLHWLCVSIDLVWAISVQNKICPGFSQGYFLCLSPDGPLTCLAGLYKTFIVFLYWHTWNLSWCWPVVNSWFINTLLFRLVFIFWAGVIRFRSFSASVRVSKQ